MTESIPSVDFPGFEHTAESVSAYLFTVDTFILSLKNGKIVHYKAKDPDTFRAWLDTHHVRDIAASAVYNGFLL